MSAYEFGPGKENNSYVFPTDFGWVYTVNFIDSADYFRGNEILFNNSLVSEIIFTRSILNTNTLRKGIDTSVKDTIYSILHHHLEGQGHLTFYIFICYSADKKEAFRMDLFIKWYAAFDTADWQLYSYELMDSNESIHYGLVVNLNHPFANQIPDEFERFVVNEKKAWKELFRRR